MPDVLERFIDEGGAAVEDVLSSCRGQGGKVYQGEHFSHEKPNLHVRESAPYNDIL